MSGAVHNFLGTHSLPPSHETGGSEVYRKFCDETATGSKDLLDKLNAAIGEFASTHGLSFERAKVYCANSRVPS